MALDRIDPNMNRSIQVSQCFDIEVRIAQRGNHKKIDW